MPVTRRLLRLLIVALALTTPLVAHGQSVLIVSQPDARTSREQFVDVAYYLERAIRDSGRLDPISFKRDLPALRSALDAHALTASDLNAPLSKEATHKIAGVLKADYVLRVTARQTKEGISADAEMEQRTQSLWTTVFVSAQQPIRTSGNRAARVGLLDAINAHVKMIVDRIAQAPLRSEPAPRTPDPASTTPPPSDGSKTPPVATPPSGSKVSPPTGPAVAPAKQDPGPSAYDLLIARARRNGDLANLILGLRRAINSRPRDVSLRRDLVQAYVDRGWPEAAREEALRAAALAPHDAAVHRRLGEAYMNAGDVDNALKEYQDATRLDGHDVRNHLALGDAYWNNGQPDDAQRAYTAAAQADPKSPLPPRRLARLYAQKSRFPEAIAAITTAKELTPADDAASLVPDIAALLTAAESHLTDALSRMQATRKGFVDSSRTREQAFRETSDQKKRAEAVSTFLEGLPASALARVQSLYVQAATLVAQSAESALLFLEGRNSSLDDEATLLRLEAGKQIAEAAKQLKALTADRKPR